MGLVGAQRELARAARHPFAVDEDLESPGTQIERNSLLRCTAQQQHPRGGRAATDAAQLHAAIVAIAKGVRRRRSSSDAEAQHEPDGATRGRGGSAPREEHVFDYRPEKAPKKLYIPGARKIISNATKIIVLGRMSFSVAI